MLPELYAKDGDGGYGAGGTSLYADSGSLDPYDLLGTDLAGKQYAVDAGTDDLYRTVVKTVNSYRDTAADAYDRLVGDADYGLADMVSGLLSYNGSYEPEYRVSL